MKWPVVKLEDIAPDMQPGFAMQPARKNVGIPHLRTNNGSEAGHLDLSSIKRVKLSKDQIAKHSLAPGDILFNNTNSPALVGKTTLNAHSLTAGRYKPQVAEQAPENEPAELIREVLTIERERGRPGKIVERG